MENRSYALLAGAFTLLLLIATIIIAIVLNRDHNKVSNYEIISDTAVSGLSEQSVVNYQGVPVGKVESLSLDPVKPGRVHIRIGIAPETPITESTWAELALQGVTGLARIDLQDDGTSLKRRKDTGKAIPTIPMRPGLFQRFSRSGDEILDNVAHISNHIATAFNKENLQALNSLLQNAATFSHVINTQVTPLLSQIDPFFNNLRETVQQTHITVRHINDLALQTRQAISQLNTPDGTLATLTRSLHDISFAASRLANETLPAITSMANQVNTAARRVGDKPESLLFGAPEGLPGPGESNFKGFRNRP